MTLEVIGTGMGRTGTLSLKLALQELGFGPCYHMEEVMKRPRHMKAWNVRARGGELDHDLVFGQFHSGVDFPVSAIWREMLERYPDAKFVHTVRDPDRWWRSTIDTIYRTREILPPWFQTLVPHLGRHVESCDALIWDGMFDGRFEDQSYAIDCFDRHTHEVVAAIPSDRLLVFEVSQGWEPLCAFLGVPVPSTPFPRVNDTKSMQRRLRGIESLVWATRVSPLVLLSAAAVLRRRGRRRRRLPAG